LHVTTLLHHGFRDAYFSDAKIFTKDFVII